MMNKSMLAIGLSLLLAFTGCQLAMPDATQDAAADRLIGVYITQEHLDLFDMEGYLSDNPLHASDGEIRLDGDSGKYQGRLYATLTERTLTQEITGETVTLPEYVFADTEGISFLAATMLRGEGAENYTSCSSDDAISDGHFGVHSGDDGDAITMEGTVYVAAGSAVRTYYVNPVYQADDGSVYAVTGSGVSFDGLVEGEAFSQSLHETAAVTDNGSSSQTSTSIDIAFSVMLPPEKIVVLQMDGSGGLISRAEYAPGKLPDAMSLEPDAAYVIVETHARSAEGAPEVSRVLIDDGSEYMETFCCREDGVCVKQNTQLDWVEKGKAVGA